MRVLIAVVALLACVAVSRRGPKAHELTAQYSFEQYLLDFDKHYRPIEKEERAKIFAASLKEVLRHNSAGDSLYKKGINKFSDWKESELKNLRGSRPSQGYKSKYEQTYVNSGRVVSDRLDYRQAYPPVLTGVKDQGQCGDCWAHSVTQQIESSWALSNTDLFVLSQQQVTSCTPQYGQCFACGGSFPTLGYEYAVQNGLTEEWIYPFASYQGQSINCSASPYMPTPVTTIVNITGFVSVKNNSQEDFVDALNTMGPLGILVDASTWSSYESGIFDGCKMSQNISLDHAVQAVGYGVDENHNAFWIVRNSWAPSWGEHGYIRLIKEPKAKCGWNFGAQNPAGCVGNATTPEYACGQCGILFNPQFPTVAKMSQRK